MLLVGPGGIDEAIVVGKRNLRIVFGESEVEC